MTADKSLALFGPGKHFGYQIAQRFAREGFHIVLVARDGNKLQELSNKLQESGVSVTTLSADVGDASLARSLSLHLQNLPSLRSIIFNVKVSVPGNGLAISPEQLTEALATNVSGALAVIQACVPLLAPGSSVILTGGGYKDVPDSEKIALSVSKGALHTLFLSMVDVLKARDVSLKTLVIDGAVREEGPIRPEAAAEAFWELYQKDSGVQVISQ